MLVSIGMGTIIAPGNQKKIKVIAFNVRERNPLICVGCKILSWIKPSYFQHGS